MEQINNTQEKNCAENALEYAIKHGANGARVTLNKGIQSNFSVLNNKLDRLQSCSDRSLYIQLFVDGRYGAYSTNRLEDKELQSFLKNAIAATKLITPDKDRTLPCPELYYKENKADLEQFDPKILEIEPKRKKEMAFECYRAINDSNNRIITANTEYADIIEYSYTIDSNGFSGESIQSTFVVNAEVSIKGSSDARPEGWWYDSSLFYNELKYKDCGNIALERAIRKLNPQIIKSGKYNVVIDYTCSTRVIAPILSALSGANIQQKNSFLIDKLGKKVFSDKFMFIDRPHLLGMSGARYFDSEGVATKDRTIIEDGYVNTYFIDIYYANKLQLAPTIEGASIPTLCLPSSYKQEKAPSQKDLLKLCNNGILITAFNGGNCNASTGDFSYGIEGFYFENGELLFPISEINITGNIVNLWNNYLLCACDARKCTRWQVGSIAFENVDISGI